MENSSSLALVNSAAQIPIPTKNGKPVYTKHKHHSNISSADFPEDFIFGCGTSAYQVEGGYSKGGKSLSIWDVFTLSNPGGIIDGSNGNLACDSYTKYKEDLREMKQMGFNSYRFSISWTRILPGGRSCFGINREGIDYYNDVIDTCIANGLEPFVTLFHWDLPDCLELEYGGFLDKRVRDDFRDYAEICFWEFGDRVKYWTTVNEPWTYTVHGYVTGIFPPFRHDINLLLQSKEEEEERINLPTHRRILNDTAANLNPIRLQRYSKILPPTNAQAPYIVAKNFLLAHAEAVHSYRTKFQKRQNGKIGIVLNSNWLVPLDPNNPDDISAAGRGVDFMLGWFLDPVLYGKYPDSMIKYVPNDNLPGFSPPEKEKLKGSIDFFGLNYYTANYAYYTPNPYEQENYYKDQQLECTPYRHGIPIGEQDGSGWVFSVPWALYEHLQYLKKKVGMPPIYITENGFAEASNCKKTAQQACADPKQKEYYQDHLFYLHKAIKDLQVDVRGHFAWSWCDNFEWNQGYTVRFGIMYVDFLNNYTRYPKESAVWYTKFLAATKNNNNNKRLIKSTFAKTTTKRQHEDVVNDDDDDNATAEEITDQVGKKARATTQGDY